MRVWAVIQRKGGAGKSTLATNLAVIGESKGEVVLLVDVDPQRSTVLWADMRGGDSPLVVDPLPDHLGNVLVAAKANGVTLAIVDTAAELDAATLATLRTADLLICPARPDLFNLAALKDTAALIERTLRTGSAVGVLNGVNESASEAQIAEGRAVFKSLNLGVCPTPIHHRAAFAVASNKGKSVIEHGKGKAAEEVSKVYAWLDRRSKEQ